STSAPASARYVAAARAGGVEVGAREERPRPLQLAPDFHRRLRLVGREPRVEVLPEPQMTAGDHAGGVEIVDERGGRPVLSLEREDIPERMARVAPVVVVGRELQAPVEITGERLPERDRDRVGGRQHLPRRAEFGSSIEREPPTRAGLALSVGMPSTSSTR